MIFPKLISIAFVLISIINLTRSIQLPQCQTSFFYQTLPLTPQESYIIDLDSLFGGYNLQYTLNASADINQYISLKPKMKIQKQQYPDEPFLGLKSYKLQKIGNTWNQRFVVLTQKSNMSKVHHGILNDNTTVPIINDFIEVENLANTTCYDAVLFPIQNKIIIDCTQKRTSPTSKGYYYDNIFYYYNISNGGFVGKIKTEMFVPFSKINKRKIDIYSDLMSQHTFLLRTYMSEGMDPQTIDNTYTQIFMIENLLDPWVVGIIDRSFLKIPRLRIMDVKIYLGEIYILDYLKGLHRVIITTSENLQYQGVYEAKGFTKFGVYSPNLDNQLQLVVANDHAIHQIDWTYIDQPRLLNKYSLLPNSIIYQVFLNDRFIFIQSSSINQDVNYNYSWILNRGDRTYSRAFKVINHDLSNTLIDLNEQFSFLMVIDEKKMTNYAFDQANLVIKLDYNQDILNIISNFNITALSSDPNQPNANITCFLQINFTLLDQYNRTMWPIGSAPPSSFNANYPGKIKIQLFQYILGPNVTYRIRETQKGQLQKAKVFQQEQLNITWIKSPPFQNITFLQTETFNRESNDTIIIYLQEKNNMVYISNCNPDHQEVGVICNLTQVKNLGGKINNWATTIFQSSYSRSTHHVLAYSTDKYYNKIFITDLTNQKQIPQVTLSNGFPGNISSLTVTGKYLYVILKHIKRVNIYPLDLCLQDYCQSICNINHMTLYRLGVRFFAPRTVHSSLHHPNIIFIKTSDTIIVLDLSKQCSPKLLTIIKPVTSAEIDFIFEVNADYLVVTIAPDIIQQYDLSRLRLKQVRITKKYPLYGNKLPKNYDFDLSDYGNCVYLSTVNEGGQYNIYVYRSGYPAVGTLYNQIDLYSYQNILIDASGYIVDYVTVVSNKQLRIFRQYQYPEAEIVNPKVDYNFFLQYFNIVDDGQLELVSVKIINLPTYIIVNPYLEDIMNTKDLLFSGFNRLNEINDSDWYEGNVLFIRPSCRDCNDKIKINNHIEPQGNLKIAPGLTDYIHTSRGGSLQTTGTLITLQSNGTIGQIILLPANQKKKCIQIQKGPRDNFQLSGCLLQDSVLIYVTTFVGNKAFSMQPYETQAVNLFKLQVAHQIVILIDIDENPYKKSRKGGIFIYEVSVDPLDSETMVQLQYLDGDDFGMRELGTIYINNAQITYNPNLKSYKLYITQMNKGLFIVEFTHEPLKTDIVIKQISFINIKKMLNTLEETLPYDATFQAITLLSTSTNSSNITTENILITTGRYNTLHLQFVWSSSSKLISSNIKRMYLRYSYYQITNHISHTKGLFLIKHQLPEEFDQGNQTKQLYTVYNTQDGGKSGIQKRGMIGAFPLSQDKSHNFDFNLTVNDADPHSDPRVGIVIVQNYQNAIQKASLHRNLSLFTTQLLDTQIIYIDLLNDFSIQKIRILLNGLAPFPQWKLITIILFSIIGAILLAGTGFVLIKRYKSGLGDQNRETLMTENQEGQN